MAQLPEKKNDYNNIKVLSVVWYKVLPPKFGGQKAVALFNQELGKLVELVCLCSQANEPDGTESYSVINTLPDGKRQFFNPVVWRQIFLAVKKEKITHLFLEFPYHGIAALMCKWFLGIKLIVRSHNIEYKRFREMGKWWWPLFWCYEGFIFKNSNLIYCISDRDTDKAIVIWGLPPKQVQELPYGISTRQVPDADEVIDKIRSNHQLKPGEKLLLFAGTLDYEPNADALVDLYEQVLPRLDAVGYNYQFFVTGRLHKKGFNYLHSLKHPGLHYLGEIDNIEEYMVACDAFVNPVSWGGGVQTKIIDALSLNANIVCFENQKAGLYWTGEKLFAAKQKDWDGFCQQIKNAASFRQPTGKFVFIFYNWEATAKVIAEQIAET